jgi:hypothetical protein
MASQTTPESPSATPQPHHHKTQDEIEHEILIIDSLIL